ncbi:MAG TPA: beta-ketoacyl-[acyl-carrier-protein] synthase II [Erysipelotrichaceae bacterium]|nr:MAG: beta-ketoacyl-[acyl-carrier-protein] synthase II [Firmicutes bacterium GWE2_51_13]HBZ42220.1 beta-ketoacyl-[acyl-carrier-protein] synthase II [Erysipelotrichaceae bacterium]
MARRVVITGMGALTPIGNNLAEVRESLLQASCGIDRITSFDTANHKVKIAAEVKPGEWENTLTPKEKKNLDKFTQYALVAAREAYADSNLASAEFDRTRFGVIVSSGIGGLGTIEAEHTKLLERGADRISPYFIPKSIINMAAGNIAIELQALGMCSSSVTACAASANAVGDCFRSIKDGYHDVMVAGGAEASITPLGIGGFTALKALAEIEDIHRASIPFDIDRSGFVMGEGSACLVLEELQHALRRNAKIYAEVVGYGATCDAYHITSPSTDGSGAARAMRQALDTANITPSDVTYLNAHGTSTPLNDAFETLAVKAVWGEKFKDLYVSSTKSMTGHLLGASGAIEAIICALSLQMGYLPPTVNLRSQDPACDLNVIANTGIKKDYTYALSNSLGFGGHNASLCFKKWVD